MDDLALSANFIITQLHLKHHIETVRNALLELFKLSPEFSPTIGLVKRFQNHKTLVPALGSWVSDGSNLPLSNSEVCDLLNENRIKSFAKKIQIMPEDATNILAKTIPLMIERAAKNGSLSSYKL